MEHRDHELLAAIDLAGAVHHAAAAAAGTAAAAAAATTERLTRVTVWLSLGHM